MSIGVLTDGEWESEMDIVKWLHDEARCGFSNSKKLKEAADEIERLRDKYDKMLGASAIFQTMIHNSLFVFEKTVDDIQQKESE